jgi:transposase
MAVAGQRGTLAGVRMKKTGRATSITSSSSSSRARTEEEQVLLLVMIRGDSEWSMGTITEEKEEED